MKILLCNPDTSLPIRNQAGCFKNTVAICPPLGIGYLAATLRKSGYETLVFDFFGAGEDKVEEMLRLHKPDIAGISCFTEHRGAALRVARQVKKALPGCHVIMGGSHASFYAERMLGRYREIDSVVMYEAEDALLAWIRQLDADRNPKIAPAGVAYRYDGEVRVNDRAPFIADLDKLPFPVRELQNNPPYRAYPERYELGRQATMMASRGCPYRCQYCSTTRYWGNKYRMRSVGNVLDELEYLVNAKNIQYVHFFDDALTARKDWILELCAGIRKRGLRFDWEAITRVNYVDADICAAMRKAGCRTVIFGVESFSDRILQTIHKGVSGAQAIEALKTAGKAGLEVTCLLMIGNPGECRETIDETIKGIRLVKPDHMDAGLTVVLPKTELYAVAEKAGLINDSYWDDESLSAPVFTLENTLERLNEFKADIFDAFWSNRWYVRLYRAAGLRKLKTVLRGSRGKQNERG